MPLCLCHSFSFAIVGINITDLAYSLLVSGALKTHLYNVAPELPSLLHFQQTFCESPLHKSGRYQLCSTVGSNLDLE